MKKTEQPNQNPEEVVKQIQDENSESVEIADENLEQKKKTTVRGRKKKSTTESKKPSKQEKEPGSKTGEEKKKKKKDKKDVVIQAIDKNAESPEEKEKEIATDDASNELTEINNGDNEHEEPEAEQVETVEDYKTFSREELVNVLEEIVKEGEINAIKKKVALIKVAFLNINKEEQQKKYDEFVAGGGDKNKFDTAEDNIEKKFNEAFAIYKAKRQRFLEEQDKIKLQNLETKKIILEELKALIDSEESLKNTYDQFKSLQERWKEIGMVPKNELNNLWQSYHFYVEKFFDKVKINKELRDLDLKKNLEAKIELCEKVEELLLETSILKSFKQLQQYHQQWKEIGPIPQDKKDEIWERFKSATDKINQRRREHYAKFQEEQNNNLLAKTALCERAEEILQKEFTTINEWQDNTNKITELLKVWKTIGSAPRKHNDEIWERFKTSLDTFFSGKKEYFQKIKEEQLNNYNLKLDLCVQAEALKTNTDWKKTTQDLINFQKEWKSIGPVPRKHSDKIWKRFRAACDEFFNNKSDYFANIEKHEADNLKLKEELIKKVEEYEFGEDKNVNLDVLKGFQREWTDIGHVPIRDKEKVQNEFRNVVNKQLDKLKISKTEIQTLNYKQRIEGMKDNPDTIRVMNNEKFFLSGKRKKLEEEIKLWENNIGFLAKSKKASLLKEEFEKKINKAKGDLEILTAKLKLLDNEIN
ncbi:MAG: DUF349 domain-containing protein [Bacteroidales bacterium]|nr:DUF349 domain-containing protein [Bacteroidales bacterium]